MTSEYGTYRLSYTPPASTGQEDYPNIAIEMSTGGDANVDQMLRFYEAFLAAAGYQLKGDLQVVEPGEYTNGGAFSYTLGGPLPETYVPFSIDNSEVISFNTGSDGNF